MSASRTPTVAVVTGAASGIGRATSRLLVARGHVVVGVDLDGAGLQQTAEVCGESGGFVARVADVSRDEDCRAVAEAAGVLGMLAVVVNCAGIQLADDAPGTLDVEAWDRTFATNVRPIFLLARHALPLLRASRGVIVNLSSVHAFASRPSTMAYAASKGAISALTGQLAVELAGDGIRVVAVAPGSVDTPMSEASVRRSGAASLAELGFSEGPDAAGRVGTAHEVAEVIVWLAGPAASFVNGTTIRADAALLATLPSSSDAEKRQS